MGTRHGFIIGRCFPRELHPLFIAF